MRAISALICLVACAEGASLHLKSQLRLRAQELGHSSSPSLPSLISQCVSAANPLPAETPPSAENGYATMTKIGHLENAGQAVIDWANDFDDFTKSSGGTAMSYALGAAAEVISLTTEVPPQDPEMLARSLVIAGVSAIPEYGPILSVMIGLVWPTKKVNLWDRIEPLVMKLIKDEIDAAVDMLELNEFKHQMRLFEEDLRQYRRAQERYSALTISSQRPQFTTNAQEWYIRYNILIETARSDARGSLHLAIARLESLLDLILNKPFQKRARYLGYFGHLAFLHLAMLKTDFIDYSGSVNKLVANAPLYAQQVNTLIGDLMASCIGNIHCTTEKRDLAQGGADYTWSCYPGDDSSMPIVIYTWNEMNCPIWNQDCNRPTNLRTRQKTVNKIHNYCIKTWIDQVNDDLGADGSSSVTTPSSPLDVIANTTAYHEIVASVVTTFPSQVVAGSGGLCAAFDSATMNGVLVSCAAQSDEMIFSTQVQDQLLAFDAKGQLHPLSDFSLCLSMSISDLNSQQLVFRECLNLPTQSWHSVPQSSGTMSIYLAADPQRKWCILASLINQALELGDCTLPETSFSFLSVPNSDDNVFTLLQRNCSGWNGGANWWQKSNSNDEIAVYFQDNFERAMGFCRTGMNSNPLSCPTKQAIYSPCVGPRRVADQGQVFVAEEGWKYFFADNSFVYDLNTPVKVFPAGHQVSCSGRGVFGVSYNGINQGCWAIPNLSAECQAKIPSDLCPMDKTFPDPRLCTVGICSTDLVRPIPSPPAFVGQEGAYVPFSSTGTFYMGIAGNFIATMVDQRLRSSGAACQIWYFFGVDTGLDNTKQCYFLPDIQP